MKFRIIRDGDYFLIEAKRFLMWHSLYEYCHRFNSYHLSFQEAQTEIEKFKKYTLKDSKKKTPTQDSKVQTEKLK